MRSFIFALCFLALAAFLIVFCSLDTEALTSEMLDIIDSLPDTRTQSGDAALDRLSALWTSRRDIEALSVAQDCIIPITVALVTTRSFYDDGEFADYRAARETLRESVIYLRELDRLTLRNVL